MWDARAASSARCHGDCSMRRMRGVAVAACAAPTGGDRGLGAGRRGRVFGAMSWRSQHTSHVRIRGRGLRRSYRGRPRIGCGTPGPRLRCDVMAIAACVACEVSRSRLAPLLQRAAADWMRDDRAASLARCHGDCRMRRMRGFAVAACAAPTGGAGGFAAMGSGQPHRAVAHHDLYRAQGFATAWAGHAFAAGELEAGAVRRAYQQAVLALEKLAGRPI